MSLEKRRRAFPTFPFLTASASTENTGPFPRLSQSTRDSLLELARTFREIDRAILSEAQINERFEKDSEGYPSKDLLALFEGDVNTPEYESPDEMWKTLSVDRIGKYNPIWNEAGEALLKLQAGSENSHSWGWSASKSRALPILHLCSDAWEIYGFEDELLKHNYRDLVRGIRGKFRSLHGFVTAYNLQPAKGREPLYNRPLYHKNQKKNTPVPFSQAQQNRNATLISIVFTATTLCLIPLFFASHHSTSVSGSTQDTDFYLLIQNAIMQLLGLFTAMYPIFGYSSGHHWRWARVFFVFGGLCSISSIPLYLYTPTMWSAIASFFGSAAQAGMALLLALMVDWGNTRVKQD